MRTVTVSQIDTEIDVATEAYLFQGINALERQCDSLLRCRVEISGGRETTAGMKPWKVRLLLSTGEHDIFVEGTDDRCGASTAERAILAALHEADLALVRLKDAHECTACCDKLSQPALAVSIVQ